MIPGSVRPSRPMNIYKIFFLFFAGVGFIVFNTGILTRIHFARNSHFFPYGVPCFPAAYMAGIPAGKFVTIFFVI